MPPPAPEAASYVDTPAGLLAADGVLYRTTEPLLRDYAGPVVEAVGLGVLLRRAGAWVRSGRTLALVFLPLLLFVVPWWAALLLAVLTYALWTAVAPGVVVSSLEGAMRVLETTAVQAVLYVALLSVFAASGEFAAVWAGVAGFVAFRLGAVEAALRPVIAQIHASLYPLPAPDQTLRSILVREALRRGISLPGIDRIEARVRAFWKKGER